MFCRALKLQGWARTSDEATPLDPDLLQLKRISGAFTNAVFFVSYRAPAGLRPPPTVLLRVYGSGSNALLSRRTELLILHTLSSLYEIGPHIMGTFANGRVEEFYQCDPIGREGMRDFGTGSPPGPLGEGTAQWVARRMRELHEVPLDVMRTVLEQGDLKSSSFGRGIENHIMASSHYRRRHASKSNTASPAWQSYSYFAHPSPALMSRHGNISTVSFDSLATSYDSTSSGSLRYTPSAPACATTSGGDLLNMSPLALGPSSAPMQPPVGPYPGVWRRLKRWTREASKVIELVNDFLSSPEGTAVCDALDFPEKLPTSIGDGPSTSRVRAKDLVSTASYWKDMLLGLLAVDLPLLCLEIAEYKQYVRGWERSEGKSRRVFCHNDSQYGNLLKLRLDEHGQLPAMASGMPRAGMSPGIASPRRRCSSSVSPHQRLVVIDFEYASSNPRAYDIANHFHEWRANYSGPNSWSLTDHGAYPSPEERERWLRVYVEQGLVLKKRVTATSKLNMDLVSDMSLPPAVTSLPASASGHRTAVSPTVPEDFIVTEVDRLEREVHVWSPATHAVWGLWGVVMARDDILGLIESTRKHIRTTPEGLVYEPHAQEPNSIVQGSEDFDNLKFGLCRFELFREELMQRGVGPEKRQGAGVQTIRKAAKP